MNWKIYAFSDYDVAIIPEPGGLAVCQVVMTNGSGILTNEARERGFENAKLIALAPEMLELLKQAKTYMSIHAEDEPLLGRIDAALDKLDKEVDYVDLKGFN